MECESTIFASLLLASRCAHRTVHVKSLLRAETCPRAEEVMIWFHPDPENLQASAIYSSIPDWVLYKYCILEVVWDFCNDTFLCYTRYI